MAGTAIDPAAIPGLLDAWRAQGADRIDPVRFHHLQALAQRAVVHDAATRRLIEARLCTLAEAYAARVGAAVRVRADAPVSPQVGVPGALARLVEAIDAAARTRAAGMGAAPLPAAPAAAGLPDLARARRVWAEVRVDSQLRQSLAQVPVGAGPLNSARLVHRMLERIQAFSPGYLRHFMAHVDALSWLERLADAGVLDDDGAGRAAVPRRRARPRKREG